MCNDANDQQEPETPQITPVVATSPATWRELRVLYESGQYGNLLALHEANKSAFADMPTMHTLQNRSAQENWDKERFNEIATELRRRNIAETLSEIGMDLKTRLSYHAECVRGADNIKTIIDQLYNKLSLLSPESESYIEILAQIKALSDTLFKGMSVSIKGLQELSKLSGDYAPEKTSEIKQHGYSTKTGEKTKQIEDLTEEEIIQDLKRMQAAGITLQIADDANLLPDEQKQG